MPVHTRIRFVFNGLYYSIIVHPKLFFISLLPPHYVIGRESSPRPSRCSRRVVRAHTAATTPALTGTGQVGRCRTLIWERRAYACAHLEGMICTAPPT